MFISHNQIPISLFTLLYFSIVSMTTQSKTFKIFTAIKDIHLFLTPAWKNQTLKNTLLSYCCGLSVSHCKSPVKCNSGAQMYVTPGTSSSGRWTLRKDEGTSQPLPLLALFVGKGQHVTPVTTYCFFYYRYVFPETLHHREAEQCIKKKKTWYTLVDVTTGTWGIFILNAQCY